MAVAAGAVAGNISGFVLNYRDLCEVTTIVNNNVCVDIVVGSAGRTTVMRMEAVVVDDRVADVKVGEAMVVMEAMVEVAEEEVGDGEVHQVVQFLLLQSQWLDCFNLIIHEHPLNGPP